MSELPVDPAAPLVMPVNTGQPMDSQRETPMKLDVPEDTHGFPPSGLLNPLALPGFLLHLRGISLLWTIPRTIRQIYLIEMQVTARISHLQWMERDGYIARLHTQILRPRPQNCQIARLQGNTYLMRRWFSGCGTAPCKLGPTLSCWTL